MVDNDGMSATGAASDPGGKMAERELWQRDAGELAALIRQGQTTSREVIEAHLGRIEQVNGSVNAIVRLLADEARAAADEADRMTSGDVPLGPLHGVPFTVKENIDLAGTPTTSSVVALADAIASVDAPVVERMRAAGAIPIGRTNLPDLGLRVTTDSSLHGISRNPWNLERTTGGSSGGEAAALATGMSPIGLGNDLGGSLRNPAHCCGIASIKPTTGVVPSATVIPPEDQTLMFQMMGVEGVMARRVGDVRLGLGIVAGQHHRDPLSVPATLTDARPGQTLRVAVLADPPGGVTDPRISEVVEQAAAALADAGHTVVPATPPGYERCVELWGRLLLGDMRVLKPLLDMVMGEPGRRFLDFADRHFPDIDLAMWSTEHTERYALARQWSAWFAEYDVLLCPTWTQVAFPEGADIVDAAGAVATLELIRPVLPANLLGLPAAVVPAGLVDGLPVGVQVMGGRFTDLRCLAAAAQIEAALGLATPIDPVVS
jgi:amidase